jgi:predicted protein tyrosine phosphatase
MNDHEPTTERSGVDLYSAFVAAYEAHGRGGTRPGRRVTDASRWWRRICRIDGSPLMMSGDLHPDDRRARRQLAEWEVAGVTHILDVRAECHDRRRVAEWAPRIEYLWLGVDDHGGRQDPAWFDAGVDRALEVCADPAARLMVHCHMGMNRGPSMAYAILLASGWDPVEALEAVTVARPIAAVIYALDALDWWHARAGVPTAVAQREHAEVAEWLARNRVDTAWVMSRIRRDEVA